jgi:predicted adenylyl cyclase CyaB
LKEHCIQKQKDIYYNIGDGRLKLRIIDNKTGTLIRYHRNEKSSKRVSKYSLIVSTDFKNLHKTLSETLGEMVTVDKKREIFVYDNVRIHLDKVKGLGNFLEFEIVFSSMAKAKQQMKTLIKYFGLDEKKFIKNSYSDLLMQNEKK